jgi:flagellar biosynthesis anti-sigma factor FlgM
MRINLDQGLQPAAETDRSSTSNTQAAAPSGGYGVGDDQAELSGTQVQVGALAAQAMQLPEVRTERVQALRQAVQEGNYSPSAESVAGALLTEMVAGPAA